MKYFFREVTLTHRRDKMLSGDGELVKEQQGNASSLTLAKRLVRLFDGCGIQVQFDQKTNTTIESNTEKGGSRRKEVEPAFSGSTVAVNDTYHTHSVLHLHRFNGDELVSGSVLLSPSGSSYAHYGIHIELRGILTVQYTSKNAVAKPASVVTATLPPPSFPPSQSSLPRTTPVGVPTASDMTEFEKSSTFFCQVQEYESGNIRLPTRFPFQFGGIKPFESYIGRRIQVHYMIYVKIFRPLKNVSHREYIFVTLPTGPSASASLRISRNIMTEGESFRTTTVNTSRSKLRVLEGEEKTVNSDIILNNLVHRTNTSLTNLAAENNPRSTCTATENNSLDEMISFSPVQGNADSPRKCSGVAPQEETEQQFYLSTFMDSTAPATSLSTPASETKVSSSDVRLVTSHHSAEDFLASSPVIRESSAAERILYSFLCRQRIFPSLFSSFSEVHRSNRPQAFKAIEMGVQDKLFLELSFFPVEAHLEEELIGQITLRKVLCPIEHGEISLFREECISSSDYFSEESADDLGVPLEISSAMYGAEKNEKAWNANRTNPNLVGGWGENGDKVKRCGATESTATDCQKEKEKLQSFEFLDGTPQNGAVVPFRFHLATVPHLTPTCENIHNHRASVKYYLNLMIITSQKRFFKEHEIIIYRRVGQECITRPQLLLV